MNDSKEHYCFDSMHGRACRVKLHAADFLALVGPPDSKTLAEMDASFKHFKAQSDLEPLWLHVTYEPKVKAWQVINHDGRHRALYLLTQVGQEFVEVVVEPDTGDWETMLNSALDKGLMCDDFAACGYSKSAINNMEGSDFTASLDQFVFIKPQDGTAPY